MCAHSEVGSPGREKLTGGDALSGGQQDSAARPRTTQLLEHCSPTLVPTQMPQCAWSLERRELDLIPVGTPGNPASGAGNPVPGAPSALRLPMLSLLYIFHLATSLLHWPSTGAPRWDPTDTGGG